MELTAAHADVTLRNKNGLDAPDLAAKRGDHALAPRLTEPKSAEMTHHIQASPLAVLAIAALLSFHIAKIARAMLPYSVD